MIFDEEVAAGDSNEKQRRIAFDGSITRVHFSFRGTGYLVDVEVFLGRIRRQDRIFPGHDDGFVNLADDTLDWPVDIPVEAGQDVTVRWVNNDVNVANRVPVLLLLEPEKADTPDKA
jgi:hypothetical protein